MRLLSVDTIEEARGKIFDAASERKPETETVHFTESCGRVLADDILAEENVPGCRKSTDPSPLARLRSSVIRTLPGS